jgi:hypothetical protein
MENTASLMVVVREVEKERKDVRLVWWCLVTKDSHPGPVFIIRHGGYVYRNKYLFMPFSASSFSVSQDQSLLRHLRPLRCPRPQNQVRLHQHCRGNSQSRLEKFHLR